MRSIPLGNSDPPHGDRAPSARSRLSGTISRRHFLQSAAAGAGALAATSLPLGCGRSDHSIRFWNGFTGPDGRTMLHLVQRFNRETEDSHVTLQRMEWSTYYNKLFVAGIEERGPEVFVVHSSSLGRMQQAGIVRVMDDIYTDHGGPMAIDDFDPNILAPITREGHRWSVPLDTHTMGMFYNKALFRQAGIVGDDGEPRVPTDREGFLDVLRRIRKLPQGDGSLWGFALTWLRTNSFAIMNQFGGSTLGPDGSPDVLPSDENVAAMEFLRGLIVEGLVPPLETMNSFLGFRQGRIAMIFEGIYVLPELRRQTDLELGWAVMPVLGTQPATFMNSHNLCLDPGLEGERLAKAKQFLEYISDNSLDWAAGGQIPARLSLRATERFQEMGPQKTFGSEIPYGVYPPQVPFVFEYEQAYDEAVEEILRGWSEPRPRLQRAADKIEEARQRYLVAFGGDA